METGTVFDTRRTGRPRTSEENIKRVKQAFQRSPMTGWSNFCTLVGHFSKLFEFAGLSRLKIPIFVPKSGCSLKKKKGLHLESVSKIPILAQNHSVLQKKITAAASDRQDLCKIDMRHAAREPVVGPRCYRRLPLLMIDKT